MTGEVCSFTIIVGQCQLCGRNIHGSQMQEHANTHADVTAPSEQEDDD